MNDTILRCIYSDLPTRSELIVSLVYCSELRGSREELALLMDLDNIIKRGRETARHRGDTSLDNASSKIQGIPI